MSQVRVRFAPSPTGYLHIGNARSALFAWLFARANEGAFLLRIEDTDRKRLVEGAEQVIYESLRWLGLDWDEGPEVGGAYGPYVQSQRLALYSQAAEELIESGHAYRCYCSPERLASLREEQQRKKENSQYDRHCRGLAAAERAAYEREGKPSVVRLKTPLGGATTFHDYLRGDVTFENAGLDDLVLLKSDGYPTYHLANVVDDHLMEITHVLRADEWISSTPRHMLLYQAFGWEPPKFAHLPMILSPEGGKLSKRHGAVSVLEYRDRGYLPEAVFNFLALLGWSPGDDREKMSVSEIISAFSLDRMSPKGAAFDETKLEWLNGQYIHEFSTEHLLDQISPLWKDAGFIKGGESGPQRDRLLAILVLLKERARRLTDFVEAARYFFEDPQEYEEKGRKSHWKGPDLGERLEALKERLEDLETFDEEHLEEAVRSLAEEQNISAAKFIHPARLAISGRSFGPGFFEMMAVLGKTTVLRRLDRAVGISMT
ncbi:MAG: glutamate--tRNA ligase [Candidatus Latescibacterota bacterium]